jgi:hypothetical protein
MRSQDPKCPSGAEFNDLPQGDKLRTRWRGRREGGCTSEIKRLKTVLSALQAARKRVDLLQLTGELTTGDRLRLAVAITNDRLPCSAASAYQIANDPDVNIGACRNIEIYRFCVAEGGEFLRFMEASAIIPARLP